MTSGQAEIVGTYYLAVPSVADLLSSLEAVSPLAKAGGWDPVGLQIGDPVGAAQKVAVCHEVTGTVVTAAVEASTDLLISYHPLLFRATTRLVAGADAVGRAYALARHGVALAVVHTAFDVAPGGVADALAESLELVDVTPFGPNWTSDTVKVVTFAPAGDVDTIAHAMSRVGAGTIGAYTGCSFRSEGLGTFEAGAGTKPATGVAGAVNAEAETRIEMIAPAGRRDAVVAALVGAHPYEEPAYDVYAVDANAGFIGRRGSLPSRTTLGEFALTVADRLDAEPRIAGDRGRLIERVAVVPGSGRSFVSTARPADVIVTGDVGHHDARAALEQGLAVIDPGHAATERPGVARLYAAVLEIAPGAVDLTAVDADPWRS